jgi:hypothetical protein
MVRNVRLWRPVFHHAPKWCIMVYSFAIFMPTMLTFTYIVLENFEASGVRDVACGGAYPFTYASRQVTDQSRIMITNAGLISDLCAINSITVYLLITRASCSSQHRVEIALNVCATSLH